MHMIRQFVPCFVAFFIGFLLVGCGSSAATTATAAPTEIARTVSPTLSLTPTPQPSATRKPKTPTPTFDYTAYYLTNPPPTPTGTPIFDADGNVTWHPQKELVSWSEIGGDGVYYYHTYITLYWNGTLLQDGNDSLGAPYVSKLSQSEICKILNTAEASGFYEEPRDYNFPFSGLGSSTIYVNGWKANESGGQVLDSAISGEPYYDTLFCRDCPIPTDGTIIRPGLANMYYLLQHYQPEKRQKASISKLHVMISPLQEEPKIAWPLTSISADEFWKACDPDICPDAGMIVEGDIAREMMQKMLNGQALPSNLFKGYPSIQITYSAVWPDVPEPADDATLTCNINSGHDPILPLNKDEKFWYYALGGKWGAERVEGENKMRVVNTSGYEKFYGYDPAFFGQKSIQVYPRYWSADGRFFYVNVLPGDFKPNVSLINSIGLQQIDVKSEKIKYLFLGQQGQTFAYEFSTDGKKVAYIRQRDTPLKLVVVDTYSGEEKSTSLTTVGGISYSSAGTLAWSRDDDKIYLAVSYEESGVQKGRILVADPQNLADIRLVYQGDEPVKLQGYGSSLTDICPMQTDWDSYCRIYLNLNTGEVQQ